MNNKILTLSFTLLSFLSFKVSNAQKIDSISVALDLIGLDFTQNEIDSAMADFRDLKANYEVMRKNPIANDLPYGLNYIPVTNKFEIDQKPINWNINEKIVLPKDKNELAFYPVYALAELIKTRKITSTELTKLFLERLKKYGDTLECVITITEKLALEQAKRADKEIAEGKYRGSLHGIPYGAKDLLAAKNHKTTWGATPYKDQVLDYDATVIKKLEEAGAVLVAKLTLGALAWGDVWYGGMTRNPWNLEEGSSGSSAGSASATAAGLVPFAIGSETWGSIVSPSTVCGTTGLRPTFGRVSRSGAMALSWTMDKLGPICRNAIDCALVLDAIRGSDNQDFTVRDAAFNYDYSGDIKKLKVGVLVNDFSPEGFNYKNDSALLAWMDKQNINLIQKRLVTNVSANDIAFVLSAEAAAAFDDLTRSNLDSTLVRQMRNAWPNVFRSARLIPAVEYIQANRLRVQLTRDFNKMMEDIDVLIAPSFSGQLLITNLTGHPCIALPNGSYKEGKGGTITVLGNHFDEASILEFSRYIQENTKYDDEHPEMFKK